MLKDYIAWFKQVLNKPKKYDTLRRFVIFKELSSFELHLINNHLHTREYGKGEYIFEEGHPLEAVFFIDKGEVEVTGTFNPPGMNILKKNQAIGLIDMFLENIRSSSARAHTDVSILAISKTDFWYLINNNHKLGAKVLIAISCFLSRYLVKVTSSQER